jgi:hypothetical protein
MGYTNLLIGLENKISILKGELRDAKREMQAITEGWERAPSIQARIYNLAETIAAADRVIRHDYPDWEPTRLKPRKPRKWTGPFKSGEIGRGALTVLRESGGWMRPHDIAGVMLEQIGIDPKDRAARQKLTNSIGGYFKPREGDLVESRGDYAKEWQVIR